MPVRFFLVERFVPAITADAASQTSAEDHRVACDLVARGVPVGRVRTILVPSDETCFSTFETDSVHAVEEAFRRAGIDVARITEAIELTWSDREVEQV